MYPYLRMVKELWKFSRSPKIGLFQTHVSHHRIWPVDLDPWRELNNGRTLTLFDLGRIPLAQRMGLVQVLRQKRWGMTVAGNSTRYRKRLTLFQRVEMRSRLIGWDQRFLYIEQALWVGEECCSHMLLRGALIRLKPKAGESKIVPSSEFAAVIGHHGADPVLPDWVQAWIASDAERVWPPQM